MSCSMSRDKLDSELSEGEAKSGTFMTGEFSPEGVLHEVVELMVLLLKAVDMTQGLMSGF